MEPQPNGLVPVRKVVATGVSGAFVTLILGLAKYAGIEMEPDFAAAIVTAVTFIAGYVTPSAPAELP